MLLLKETMFSGEKGEFGITQLFSGSKPTGSDWSIREIVVSGVSSAPTVCPTVPLATPHLVETKSACSALSTWESQ